MSKDIYFIRVYKSFFGRVRGKERSKNITRKIMVMNTMKNYTVTKNNVIENSLVTIFDYNMLLSKIRVSQNMITFPFSRSNIHKELE